jgi:hypothetical protein
MQRMMKYCLLPILVLVCSVSFAQSKKKKKEKKETKTTQQQPSSLNPYYPTEEYEPVRKKQKNRKRGKITYNAERKFYERMEDIAKAEKKAEKEFSKPQHSDPLYFGHKKPPKKRSPKRMKYCKVCGIRH